MDKLIKAREEINRIDAEMRRLFLERMNAVKAVSEYKAEHALPTLDSARENAVIETNASLVADETMRGYYIEFLQNNMKISRSYQDRLRSGMKVAFAGVSGAYADIAADKIFKNATKVAYPDFKSAYDSVISGECDCAVLPIENSTAGEVGAVIDMLFSGSLYISGVYDLFISHHLVAKKGTNLSDIKEVVSHAQAFSQCSSYIKKMGFKTTEFGNTAAAAKFVSESEKNTIAAIASAKTAKLYDLEILEKNVNDKNVNTTRFATVSRTKCEAPLQKDRHSIMMFTVSNEAGSLARAISIIGEYGYNMRCLRSRPMKELLWKYYFYVEAEGNLDTDNGKKMIEELKKCCDKLKILGTFKFPCDLNTEEL